MSRASSTAPSSWPALATRTIPWTSPRAAAPRIRADPPDRIIARHEAAWAERWRRGGVVIDGAPKLERALRFALYHLVSAANPDDPRCSIGARALSGEAYRGHVFWDTEIFMLPFFTHATPRPRARCIGYRPPHAPGRAAQGRGVRLPRRALRVGVGRHRRRATPTAVVSPFGEVDPRLGGEQEHHISADVAYAVARLRRGHRRSRTSLRGRGREILIETARFWASRVERGADGLFHIRRVIGPDEYHEAVDDNAFTNWMARHNLRAPRSPAGAARAPTGSRGSTCGPTRHRWRAVADADVPRRRPADRPASSSSAASRARARSTIAAIRTRAACPSTCCSAASGRRPARW